MLVCAGTLSSGAFFSCCNTAVPGHLEFAEPLLEKAKGAALSHAFPSGVTAVEGDSAGSWNQAQIYELA